MIGNLIEQWRKSGWMSPPGTADKRYRTRSHEHIANILTFLLGVAYAIYMLKFVFYDVFHDSRFASALIYSFSFLVMVTFSTLFHFLDFLRWKKYMPFFKVLHVLDRCGIYLFICGSYTPWLGPFYQLLSSNLFYLSLIWIGGLFGCLFSWFFYERYKLFSTLLYLFLGLAPSPLLYASIQPHFVAGLARGGAVYIVGVLFFKSDGYLPFAHAIWHLFVVAGAAIDFHVLQSAMLSNNFEL